MSTSDKVTLFSCRSITPCSRFTVYANPITHKLDQFSSLSVRKSKNFIFSNHFFNNPDRIQRQAHARSCKNKIVCDASISTTDRSLCEKRFSSQFSHKPLYIPDKNPHGSISPKSLFKSLDIIYKANTEKNIRKNTKISISKARAPIKISKLSFQSKYSHP